jgi:hypothetical protein
VKGDVFVVRYEGPRAGREYCQRLRERDFIVTTNDDLQFYALVMHVCIIAS